MANKECESQKLPANYRGNRCGHNFVIANCPHEGCESRENKNLLDEARAEIARLIQELAIARAIEQAERDIARRYLGWCDLCYIYHRTGNCDKTGEPPSREAREAWSSLPTKEWPIIQRWINEAQTAGVLKGSTISEQERIDVARIAKEQILNKLRSELEIADIDYACAYKIERILSRITHPKEMDKEE